MKDWQPTAVVLSSQAGDLAAAVRNSDNEVFSAVNAAEASIR